MRPYLARTLCASMSLWFTGLSGGLTSPLLGDEVVLVTGIRTRGRVVRADPQEVVLETEGGREVRFPRAKVSRVTLSRPEALRLGDDLFANGFYAAAADAYERALAAIPGGVLRQATMARRIDTLLASGAEAKAVVAFLDLAAEYPQAPELGLVLPFGLPLTDPVGVQAAVEARLRLAAGEAPLSVARPLAQAALFWATLSRRDTEAARRLAGELAASDDPRFRSLAVVARGWLSVKAGRPAEAVRDLERLAPRLNPFARPHAELLLIQAHADLGHRDERTAAALRLAFAYDDLGPLAAEGLAAAAQALLEAKRDREAKECLKTLLARYPASPRAAEAKAGTEAAETQRHKG